MIVMILASQIILKKADENLQNFENMSSMRLSCHISNENRLAVFQLRPSLYGRRNVLGNLLWHILPTSKGKVLGEHVRVSLIAFECFKHSYPVVSLVNWIPWKSFMLLFATTKQRSWQLRSQTTWLLSWHKYFQGIRE